MFGLLGGWEGRERRKPAGVFALLRKSAEGRGFLPGVGLGAPHASNLSLHVLTAFLAAFRVIQRAHLLNVFWTVAFRALRCCPA
eukprot:14190420-Alexandrium_andersonii.AAC.1